MAMPTSPRRLQGAFLPRAPAAASPIRARQRHEEAAAAAGGGRDADAPAAELHRAAHDGEPQPVAGALLRRTLIKLIEDVRLRLLVHAAARVGDGDADLPAPLPQDDADLPAGRRKANGVRDEIRPDVLLSLIHI